MERIGNAFIGNIPKFFGITKSVPNSDPKILETKNMSDFGIFGIFEIFGIVGIGIIWNELELFGRLFWNFNPKTFRTFFKISNPITMQTKYQHPHDHISNLSQNKV